MENLKKALEYMLEGKPVEFKENFAPFIVAKSYTFYIISIYRNGYVEVASDGLLIIRIVNPDKLVFI